MQRRGPNRSLFVRPIDAQTRPDELKAEFARHGAVRDVHIPADFHTRQPRGFSYVEMEDIDAAEQAQRALNNSNFNGKKLIVAFADGDRKTPGQMKQSKEAIALKDQIQKLRELQRAQKKQREDDMRREGIPISGDRGSEYGGRRFHEPPSGRRDRYKRSRSRSR